MFNECVEAGVEPDQTTYGAFISVLQSYKNRRIAFDFMVLDGTDPDESIVRSILKPCLRHLRTGRHKAESLFAFMEHEGIAPSTAVWNDLLKIYRLSGDLAGVCDGFLRMRQAGMQYDNETYQIFLAACATHARSRGDQPFALAEHAFSQAGQDGLRLNLTSHVKLLKVYAAVGEFKRSVALVKRVGSVFGYIPSVALWEYRNALRKGGGPHKRVLAVERKVRGRFLEALRQQPQHVQDRFAAARKAHRRALSRGQSLGEHVAPATPATVQLKKKGWTFAARPAVKAEEVKGAEEEVPWAAGDEADESDDGSGQGKLHGGFEGKLRAVSRNVIRVAK
eukprot:Hpha_TRINITY_DN15717_c1_g3::TRINITY_DN15717_c1_g3_i1::g.36550::m.36550